MRSFHLDICHEPRPRQQSYQYIASHSGRSSGSIKVNEPAVMAAGASKEEEAFVHSFHLDLRQNPEQKALLEGMAGALAGTLGKAGQHITAWRSLDALWTADKAAAVEQLKVVHLYHNP